MNANFSNEGTFTPDVLLAGDAERVTEAGILISGQNLPRGAVLGRITASKKWTLSLSASSDGSEVPRAILAVATDASGGDKKTSLFRKGEFNEDAVTFGTAHSKTAIATLNALNDRGIFLKSIVGA